MTHQHKIPDEVVEASLAAWFGNSFVRITECDGEYREEMRAALQTAFSMLLGEPVAWMRRWSFDNEVPVRSLGSKGRMALAFKYKLLEVTKMKCLKDDVKLYALKDKQP